MTDTLRDAAITEILNNMRTHVDERHLLPNMAGDREHALAVLLRSYADRIEMALAATPAADTERLADLERWWATVDSDDKQIEAQADGMREALDGMIVLFEMWRDGIFAKQGITWVEEPPAIQTARTALAAIAGKAHDG